MAFFDLDEAGEIGDVAVHAVEAFRDDQDVLEVGAPLAQQKIQMVEIVVAEEHVSEAALLEPLTMLLCGQFVEEETVARSHDMRDDGDIGQIAADERQGRFRAEKCGERGFKMMMGGAFAADKARGKRAYAEFGKRFRPPPALTAG